MRLSEETLSVAEVAAMCRVNRRTVLRWVEDGGLRATRYGPRGRWRITDDALDSFIEVKNQEQKGESN